MIPDSILEQRRRAGLDGRDEMWEGVLHLVPPPNTDHQDLSGALLYRLRPLARARGLRAFAETGVFDPSRTDSYRVPDLVVAREADVARRGVDGPAVLVVEIRSPGDETFEKLPFFDERLVAEVVVIDRDSRAVRRWTHDGAALHEVAPDSDRWHHLAALPVALREERGLLGYRSGDDAPILLPD